MNSSTTRKCSLMYSLHPCLVLLIIFQVTGVLPMFSDLDSLVLQLVKIPKKATLHTSRAALNCLVLCFHILRCTTNVAQIYLKHCLEVVPKLAAALKGCKNTLFQAALRNLQNPSLAYIKSEIYRIIKEDTLHCKSVMQMRTQQAFAIKVTLPSQRFNSSSTNSPGLMVTRDVCHKLIACRAA